MTQNDPGLPFHPSDVPDKLRPAGEGGPEKPVVVVGVDGSEQSRAALEWALRYAELVDARVEPVAVWHQPLQFGDDAPVPAGDFEAEARAWLAEALPPRRATPPVDPRIERGDPAHILLDCARRADLLVLGNHGRGALGGMVLGSVAQRCAHHARCPVLLVPTPK